MKELGVDILAEKNKKCKCKAYLINNIDELIKYYENRWSVRNIK